MQRMRNRPGLPKPALGQCRNITNQRAARFRADISVAGRRDGQTVAAALRSPPTRSAPIDPLLQADLLQLLDYAIDDLD
jgi:hypothetical protein